MRHFFLIFCFFLTGFCFSQENESIVYECVLKIENDIPLRQEYHLLTLHSDSSYNWTVYTGEIEDKKQNYLAWEKSESFGKWKFDKDNLLVLVHGDIKTQYLKRKNYLKRKRFQHSDNGGYKATYDKWLFEKVVKFYLKK